jgi:tetratricopeptide (TPR) repeat protein
MNTPQAFPYDIFLSHNRAQKDWTRELVRRLREDGFEVWFDEFVLPKRAGKNWIDSLVEGVEQSRKVALVWSPEFFDHEWPKFEANVLQLLDPVGDKERILPLIHTHCDLPKRWAFLQGLDFTGCAHGADEFEFRYHQLVHNLDNSRPYEGDFQLFQQKQRQRQSQDLEQIPPVRPLPKGSRMPRAPIGNFVGREKELRDLARSLTPGSGSLVGVHAAVTGMGGVGKTQLAIEYAHRYGRRYPGGVFWINLEKAEDAVTEVASCGPQGMNLEGFSDRSAPEQAALVRKLWEDGEAARLLIFDNAEEHALVEQWRPKYGHCSVLITSRRDYWPLEMNVQSLPIETLPRPNSMQLLEKARSGLLQDEVARQAADDLCGYLGDLPLALQVAAAYLRRYRSERVQDYLRDLRQASGADPALERVWSCFAVSYRKLKLEEETDAVALRLFQLAGSFAPSSIARSLLAEAGELDLTGKQGRKQLNSAVARLQELALMAEEPDGRLFLHRLLWEFSRQQHLPQSKEAVALRVGNILLSFAGKENTKGLPQGLSKERVHLRQAAMEAERWQSELAAHLYNSLGYHGNMLALLQEAKSDFERALKIYEDAYGSEHPYVSTPANNIGQILQAQGDLAGALEYSRRALKIDEKVYGPDHPDVATDVNNIGQILQAQGDLAGALEYSRRALKIDEKAYGPDHPKVGRDANNIGMILKAQGDLAGALEHSRRALKIDEQVYGPDHPRVATSATNIGAILKAQGHLAEALQYSRRALKIDEQVYGSDHPEVATDANNIGTILNAQGHLAEALEYSRRALKIDEQVYGSDHPNVATDVNNIGQILKAQGDLAGALEHSRRALKIDEQVYGPDHPNVGRGVNNIGQILEAQGDLAGALEYARRAVAILEKVYGPDNPTTKVCAGNLRALQKLIEEKKQK